MEYANSETMIHPLTMEETPHTMKETSICCVVVCLHQLTDVIRRLIPPCTLIEGLSLFALAMNFCLLYPGFGWQ